jgi:N-acylneuraminate cytidylyltransferase
MRIAIVPARGGSKRIPRKNIKLFAGQPVLAYPVRAALASKCFDDVIVSTDDDEIALVARTVGASTPFMRPSELADDHTVLVDVITHAIQWFHEHGQVVSEVCCIFATAPFVTPKALRVGLETLQTSGRNFALSITSFPFPVQRAVRMASDGGINAMYPEFRETRSQDLEPCWHDAGQFCWGTRQAFLDRLPVFSEHTAGVVLPRHLVQDLDTLEDWRRAELMYEVLRQWGELT